MRESEEAYVADPFDQIVEMIIADKYAPVTREETKDSQDDEVEHYLVKFKGFSYH